MEVRTVTLTVTVVLTANSKRDMASTFFQWIRSPAARQYFFSKYSLVSFPYAATESLFSGTHFWGPVRCSVASTLGTTSQNILGG